MRISKIDRNYFLYALALVAYGAYDAFQNKTDNFYYYFMAAVLAGLGFFRGALTRLMRGKLHELDVVQLTLCLSTAGYAVYDWFSRHVVDYQLLAVAALLAGLGVYRYMQRSGRGR